MNGTANDLPPWASKIAMAILAFVVATLLGLGFNVLAGQGETLTEHEARLLATETREDMIIESLRDLKESHKDVVQRLDTMMQRLPSRGGR